VNFKGVVVLALSCCLEYAEYIVLQAAFELFLPERFANWLAFSEHCSHGTCILCAPCGFVPPGACPRGGFLPRATLPYRKVGKHRRIPARREIPLCQHD
jgi:hypothetical protein